MKNFERIGTFKEFLNEQKNTQLKEGSVTLNCEFWDEAIEEVMQDLQDEVYALYSWNDLYKYVKARDSILGRETSIFPEKAILSHIKELIFQHHGNSYFKDNREWIDWDNTTIHSKAVVIEELARTILNKVKELTHKTPDPQDCTATLVDRKSEDDSGDELPFEGHRRIKRYGDYSKLLKEAVYQIKYHNYQDCMEFCMDTIKNEAGSLKLGDILKVAKNMEELDRNYSIIGNYIHKIVMEYMALDNNVLLDGDFDEEEKENLDDVLDQAMETFANLIVDDILDKIEEESC